jgi:hypothetical protein
MRRVPKGRHKTPTVHHAKIGRDQDSAADFKVGAKEHRASWAPGTPSGSGMCGIEDSPDRMVSG